MKYREANVWIFAHRQIGLPFLVAETVTHYLTGAKIMLKPGHRLPIMGIDECIKSYLSGTVDKNVIKHGLFPYRMYEYEAGRTGLRQLFCKHVNGDWNLTDWHYSFPYSLPELEELVKDDETLPQFWEQIYKNSGLSMYRSGCYVTSVSCAHVEVGEKVRIVIFNRAVV